MILTALFYISGATAVIAATLVVLRANAMHALISLVALFLAVASVFYTLGASFLAVLQIVVYAGAIMVLFVFVVMMLNLGRRDDEQGAVWLAGRGWMLATTLAAVLLMETVALLVGGNAGQATGSVSPKTVGISLFTTYITGVELASILLLSALVAAFHFGFMRGRLESADG